MCDLSALICRDERERETSAILSPPLGKTCRRLGVTEEEGTTILYCNCNIHLVDIGYSSTKGIIE